MIKFMMFLFTVVFFSLMTIITRAEPVSGYYRSNGTYVQSYERSSANNTKSDNYGSGSGAYYTRDADRDGTANYLDMDDDGDGIYDDNE